MKTMLWCFSFVKSLLFQAHKQKKTTTRKAQKFVEEKMKNKEEKSCENFLASKEFLKIGWNIFFEKKKLWEITATTEQPAEEDFFMIS